MNKSTSKGYAAGFAATLDTCASSLARRLIHANTRIYVRNRDVAQNPAGKSNAADLEIERAEF